MRPEPSQIRSDAAFVPRDSSSPSGCGIIAPAAMSEAVPSTVTRLLKELGGGNRAALDALFPIIYAELRTVARRHRRRWRGDYTLDTTALVHEAYLKLSEHQAVRATSRAHFLAVAARAMRHILCNYARDRQRQKRGGSLQKLTLDDAMARLPAGACSDDQAAVLASLASALDRLEQVNPRQGRIVECRFFGGLSIDETAAALGLSPATVKRDWNLARAWLYREMSGPET